MDLSLYLFVGLLIGGLLFYHTKLSTLFIVCLYWFIPAFWALGTIEPFSYASISWVQLFNINISYQIDGLAHLFTFLIAEIGIIVLIYAWLYTAGAVQKRKKLLSLLQLFAVSMLGVVLANDMVMLFLCWELTSIISYLLIQFKTSEQEANQVAFNSLFVSVLGGLLLLVGFIVLNNLSGTWNINSTITSLQSAAPAQLTIAFYLILFGVITKSAQFPFYFWLTGAMQAPTPVSAYLHSATMVNAGIYLLARFHPLFSTLDIWYPVLSCIGLTTMAISSILSLYQKDLKSVLAYTTIFVLAAMVYLLGGETPLPIEAFAILLLFHGTYKAGAFMLVGIIDKEYHTRQLNKLSGIARNRLPLALSTIIIFGAMAGLPPFFGFTVKEMIYEAKLASPTVSYFLMGVSILSSMFIAATCFRCLWYFFKSSDSTMKPEVKNNNLKLIFLCPAFLTISIVLFSIFDYYIEFLVEPATQAILSTRQLAHITTNTPTSIFLSLITSCGGVLLFVASFRIKKPAWSWFQWLELRSAFESVVNCLLIFGRQITVFTQGQAFTNQLRIFFSGFIIILLSVLATQTSQLVANIYHETYIASWFICCFLLLSSLSLLISYNFLYNLISLSIIGLCAGFFFIVNGSVDVALAQFLVEVLTIIILLIALRSIEIKPVVETKSDRIINGIIALSVGSVITYLLFALETTQFNQQLQIFYAKNSYLIGHGKNIVNVILVDFRSLDTFGEALVVIATAIATTLVLKKYATSKREKYVNHH